MTALRNSSIAYGVAISGRMLTKGRVERHLSAKEIARITALAFEAGIQFAKGASFESVLPTTDPARAHVTQRSQTP